MSLNVRLLADAALTTYLDGKRDEVERAGGPADVLPLLQVFHTTGEMGVVALTWAHPTDCIAQGLLDAVHEGGAIATALMLADSFRRDMELTDPRVRDIRRGYLADEFEASASVQECLTVQGVSALGPTATATVDYRYGDTGELLADPVRWLDGPDFGDVARKMRAGLNLANIVALRIRG